MSKAEIAVCRFKEGALCSQSVFTAFCEELGLDRETASKIATPFGGGMARFVRDAAVILDKLLST